jgi:hypothetical protein
MATGHVAVRQRSLRQAHRAQAAAVYTQGQVVIGITGLAPQVGALTQHLRIGMPAQAWGNYVRRA